MNSRILPLALTLATAFAMPLMAQERTAATPTNNVADLSNDAMVRKISYQTQVITVLQAQLKACQNGEPFTPDLPKDTSGFSNAAPTGYESSRSRTEATPDNTSVSGTSYTTQQAAPPPPPRRPVGVYQQPAEQRLTCADYSKSYFSRHPAMAAVCGAITNPPQPQPEEPTDENADGAPDAPTGSAPSTIRLPQHP